MKYQILHISLLVVSLLPIKMQEQLSQIDSLTLLLQKHTISDSVRVNLLNELADISQSSNQTNAMKYASKALELTETINYRKGKAEAFNQLATSYYTRSIYDTAIHYAEKSLSINRNIGYKKGIAKSINTIGNIYYYQGQLLKAMEYSQKALKINLEINDSLAFCYNYANLGTDYSDIGDFKTALVYIKKAMDIAYKLKNDGAISYTLNNAGVVYNRVGNSPKALEYYQKSFDTDVQMKNYKGASIVASNIAHMLELQSKYDEGLAYCQKGLNYALKIDFKTGMTYNYENMGDIYISMKNYEKAIENHEKALNLHIENGDSKGIAVEHIRIADIYRLQNKLNKAMNYYVRALNLYKKVGHKWIEIDCNIGMAAVYNSKKEYNLAYKHGKKAYTMAINSNDVDAKKRSAEVFSKSCEALGLFSEAYRAHVVFKAMSDTIFSKDNIKKRTDLEYKYKYEKEKEILELAQKEKDKLQTNELKKQKAVRNSLLVAFTLAILLMVVIFRSFLQNRKSNRVLTYKNQKINNQAKELREKNNSLLELSKFKEDMTNMVVHDLKSPLAVILSVENLFDHNKRNSIIKQSALQMMNLVNNILDLYKYQSTEIELRKENISLSHTINLAIEEVDILAKMRNIEFKFEVPNAIMTNADSVVLHRVFVNLLSNAIKYSPKNGKVIIVALLHTNNEAKISIQNFGPAIPVEKHKLIFTKFGQAEKKDQGELKSTGIGLTYCKLAVEAHKGIIGFESTETDGTTFWFSLPNSEINSEPYNNVLTNSNVHLTEDQKNNLKHLHSVLANMSVMEITSFNKMFEAIETNELGNTIWIEALKDSIYNCDESAYKKLIDMIL